MGRNLLMGAGNPLLGSNTIFDARRLKEALRTVRPPLLFGLRLWASVCLALYVAFWLELDNHPYWAGLTAAIVCQPSVGASLRKGWFRMIGTVVGAVAIVVLTACFPQNRAVFLAGLALWGAACALVSTLLRNFAAYAAALAGYTAAIIAVDQLGATGGVNGDAFMLAVYRVSEIAIGIVCAGIVLALTDLGGARRRLAELFAGLTAGIAAEFGATLALAGSELPDTQPVRRDFIRRVIALDPVIDEAVGESSEIHYHSPVLQKAVDGLFSALVGWRAVANHLVRLPRGEAQAEAAVVLRTVPQKSLFPPEQGNPARWANPTGLRQICETAVRRLITLPAGTPSQRLLADNAAEVLAGMSYALDGLALLVADHGLSLSPRRGTVRLRVPDWLPALVNAGRAFVTIGVVQLFWIVTAWPSGGDAVEFAAITVILFAPQAEQAYAAASGFTVGTLLAAVFAAIIAFAVLPGLRTQSFAALSIVLGLYLIPTAALATQPWQKVMFTAMTVNFVALLSPANPMSYDTVQFYNGALGIVAGTGAAALGFRMLPPLSPTFRTRRLLALTLRDLRRVARGRTPRDWEGHVYGRLSVMPPEATPLQRAQVLAALSAGVEILRLRNIMRHLGPGVGLDSAFAAISQGNSSVATADLAQFDTALAARVDDGLEPQTLLRARGSSLALSEVLTQHAAYFDAPQ